MKNIRKSMKQYMITAAICLLLAVATAVSVAVSALAEKTLGSVGLPRDYYNRLPAMLSGGEQQRVAIARAIAGGQKIILADEPTGNLDEENSQNVMDMLKRLAHEQNYCVIIVTHDPQVAADSDAVIRMSSGRIMEE